MGEPEGLLIEGARLATAGARELWWRLRPPAGPPVLALAQVRRRLELFLGALHDGPTPIGATDAEPAPTWLARLLGRAPRYLTPSGALAATDGERVWLPRVLDALEGPAPALERYRLLALEQAARLSGGFAQGQPLAAPRLERDLYQIAQAATVDRTLARELPGLGPALQAARAAALADRPPLDRLTPPEQAVEDLVRAVLVADPLLPPPSLGVVDTPAAARAWAAATARRLGTAPRYRGMAPVALWGEARLPVPAPAPGARAQQAPASSPPRSSRSAAPRRSPRVRAAADNEDDASPGMWMVRFDDPMESVEDPMGLRRPADQGDARDAGEPTDGLSDLPEARIIRTPEAPREVLESDGGAARVVEDRQPHADAPGITYPEWDHRVAAYRLPGAVVRPAEAPAADATWAAGVLRRHAALVRRVRRRFDGLRPSRIRRGRQPDGADVDLDAYVGAFADRCAGRSGDDRLYITTRPARRDLAITVLVDVSASTDAWVAGTRRVIDVEKEALTVLLEALDVLGDRHSVLAFSGQGPRAVHLFTIKGFDEASAMARRRIAALEPDGYTRVGAAVRHATALLGRERARHRLLLLLSDGKPNDVDEYAGRYGIEDTRQAVAEGRVQGLVPFCLTVDREAPTYVPAIFGPRGYAVLPRTEQLPVVLVEVLRSLLIA